MNKITTISTCGRCGIEDRREGAIISDPPQGWATASLVRRLKESHSVYDSTPQMARLFDDALCPPCQDAVLAVLKPAEPWKHVHSHSDPICYCLPGLPCKIDCKLCARVQ